MIERLYHMLCDPWGLGSASSCTGHRSHLGIGIVSHS